MIPKLSEVTPIQAKYLSFIERLDASGFSGDTNPDYANRATLSTENAIYHGIIYPKNTDDIQLLVQLSNQEEFRTIALNPMTDTDIDGQSLTNGLTVDFSKYMMDTLKTNTKDDLLWSKIGVDLLENDTLDPSLKDAQDHKDLMHTWLLAMKVHGVDITKASKSVKNSNSFIRFFPKLLHTIGKRRGSYDFSNEVHKSVMGCLTCNETDFRANFLELYYSRYLRPIKHHLICSFEFIAPSLATFPRFYNWLISRTSIKKFSSKYLGLSDCPKLSKYNLKKEMSLRGIRWATPLAIESLSYKDRLRAVIVVQDALSTYVETKLVLDSMELLSRLGFQGYLAPYMPNGKPLYDHGFMKAFNRTARKNLDMLQSLSFYGLPFIGIDPSMTLTYRSEYTKAFGNTRQIPNIQLMQEWLALKEKNLIHLPLICEKSTYHLMTHCTEKTDTAEPVQGWQKIYSILGLELKVENLGCCGMAGTYGHETEHQEMSKAIYELYWKEKVTDPELTGKLVATSYACRSQAKRFDDVVIPHPAQILLKHLREMPAA